MNSILSYQHNKSREEHMRLAKALFLIGTAQEIKPAYDFMVKALSDIDRRNRREKERFRENQGAAQVLEDLIAMIDRARDDFDDFDKMESRVRDRRGPDVV